MPLDGVRAPIRSSPFSRRSQYGEGVGETSSIGWSSEWQRYFTQIDALLVKWNRVAIGVGAQATETGATAVGKDARATGSNAVAIGHTVLASGSNSIAVGQSTNATGANSTAIGQSTNATGANSTAIGQSANAAGSSSVAVGRNANAAGASSIAIGDNTTTSDQNVAIGNGANTSGVGSVAIGAGAGTVNGYTYTIAIGANAAPTANAQGRMGGTGGAVTTDWYWGGRNASDVSQALTHQPYESVGTNIAGVDLRLAGGKSTGTGLGGLVRLQTSAPGSSGSSLNGLTDRIITGIRKTLTDGVATDLVVIDNDSDGEMSGGLILYTVVVDSGSQIQVASGIMAFTAFNNGGTQTHSIGQVGTELQSLSAGTLTMTWSTANDGAGAMIRLNADSSLNFDPVINYTLINNSGRGVTLQ